MKRVTDWLAGFFEERRPQSMARLVAFGCGLAGCAVALLYPEEHLTVAALIGGGAVAILSRTKTPPPNGGGGERSAPSSGPST